MTKIGVIGTGHIAAPMVRFLVRKGHDLTVTKRNEAVSSALAQSHGVACGTAQDVIDRSDILLLCLRPHVARDVLGSLRFHAHQGIVSVMAGITRSELQGLCAPAVRIVQTIPLGFLEQGGCPLAAFGDEPLLKALFSPENPVVSTNSETALNAHFAICAMVPGILDLMATGAGWLARETGAEEAAETYTTQLISGFLATLPGTLEEARDALATPDTLSLQMTDTLREGGAHRALDAALETIGERLAR